MADITTTSSESIPDQGNYGGLVDAVGGIATVVLAIVALAGVHADMVVGIATIIFGAALLVHGGTLVSEYANMIFPPGAEATSTQEFGGGMLAAVFLVGAGGIVLGVLALLGIYPTELTAIAAIAFGSALMLGSNAVWHIHRMKQSAMIGRTARDWRLGREIVAGEMASGSAGMQALAGLASVILGILAVVGTVPATLTMVALLVLGTTIVLTGDALSGAVLSFMHHPSPLPTRGTATFGGRAD